MPTVSAFRMTTFLVVMLDCLLLTHGLSKQQAEMVELTAVDAVARLCAGRITATEYAEALLAQIDTHRCLNTFASLDAAKVLREAKAVDDLKQAGKDTGPLCGLTFAVKDNIDVVGYPTVAGTPALHGMLPSNSSPIVTRLLKAHGVVMGKAHMEELAYGLTTINPVYGPVLNPYNNTRDVGGSSGGSGSLVAARLAPGAFCSDTGGSCRVPGAHTGTVGWRPTLGCYNAAGGIVPMTTSRDTVGIIARTARDVILFDEVFSDCDTSKPSIKLEGLRVGYPTNLWKGLDTKAEKAFEAALGAMVSAGIELVEFDMSLLSEGTAELFSLLLAYEMPRELSRYLYSNDYNISLSHLVKSMASPHPKAMMEAHTAVRLDSWPTPVDYAHSLTEVIPQLKKLYRQYLDSFKIDLVVTPTTHLAAAPIARVQPWVEYNGQLVDTFGAYAQTVFTGPPLSVPGISLPIGLDADGMPLGIQFEARPYDDQLLLAFSEAVEDVLPPTPPPPTIPACLGCTPKVHTQETTYSGTGKPKAGDVTSIFTLEFDGTCLLKGTGTTAHTDSVAEL